MSLVFRPFFKINIALKKIWWSETAKLSEGNIGKSIHFVVGNDLLEQNTQEFQNWMRMCYKAKVVDLASWVDVASSWGREQQRGFYSMLYIWLEKV